jgi:hypothetical protein
LEDEEKPEPGPPFEKESEWLSDLELAVKNSLMLGKALTTDQINQIMTI